MHVDSSWTGRLAGRRDSTQLEPANPILARGAWVNALRLWLL